MKHIHKGVILDGELERVIIKYSVIITLFTFVLSKMVSKSVSDIVDVFLGFLFQFDFDRNGVPDLTQLKKIDVKIFKMKFSLGKLIYAVIKLAIQILIIMTLIKIFIVYTPFIRV